MLPGQHVTLLSFSHLSTQVKYRSKITFSSNIFQRLVHSVFCQEIKTVAGYSFHRSKYFQLCNRRSRPRFSATLQRLCRSKQYYCHLKYTTDKCKIKSSFSKVFLHSKKETTLAIIHHFIESYHLSPFLMRDWIR